MVKDPFRKWDRVDTFCTLLVDLGKYVKSMYSNFNLGPLRVKGQGTSSLVEHSLIMREVPGSIPSLVKKVPYSTLATGKQGSHLTRVKPI